MSVELKNLKQMGQEHFKQQKFPVAVTILCSDRFIYLKIKILKKLKEEP